MQNTNGAAFVDGLEMDWVDLVIEKGQERLVEAYSAFTDSWGLFRSILEDTLKDKGITDVFVVGLGMDFSITDVAEDYCVKWTALDSRKRGFRTVVVEDCTKGVADESTETARQELKQAGVEYQHSSEVYKLFSDSTEEDMKAK